MTMLKKGTCLSSVTISSMVYICENCGHTEIAMSETIDNKECPKCHSKMSLISFSCEAKSPPDNSSDSV